METCIGGLSINVDSFRVVCNMTWTWVIKESGLNSCCVHGRETHRTAWVCAAKGTSGWYKIMKTPGLMYGHQKHHMPDRKWETYSGYGQVKHLPGVWQGETGEDDLILKRIPATVEK